MQKLRTIGLFTVLIGATILAGNCGGSWFGFKKDAKNVYSGTVETREVRIGSKVGGRVEAVLVQEGQVIEAGAPVLRFDMADLKTQRAQAAARTQMQQARLTRLLRGSRVEEKGQARAATETARASLEAVRNGPRPEEIAQARASLSAAEAEVKNAEATFDRESKLRSTGDNSQQVYDSARFALENQKARRDSEKTRLEMLLKGSRVEDVRAAEERFRQSQEAEKMVLAGPRSEDIADARAQLAEAQARLEQIDVQLAEGEVKSPSRAVVEVLSIRPGDLLTPNQTVARLLEEDQIFIRIYVPEPLLGLVKIGQRAKIRVDSFPDRNFDGVVDQINSQGEFTPRNVQSRDERNHLVFGVKVRIDNREGKIKAGMAADVTLEQ